MNPAVRFATITVLLIASTMTLLLSVVCLFYVIYLDAAPKMREEMPTLLAATAMFAALMAVSAAAFQGWRRNASWKWVGQAALWLLVVGVGFQLKASLLG